MRLLVKLNTGVALLVFATLASAPFFWTAARGGFHYLARADYLCPINVLDKLHRGVFPFNHLISGGIDESFQIAQAPLLAFFYFFQRLGFSQLETTLILIGAILFLAQASFYFFIQYASREKLGLSGDGDFISIFGSVLYGFSPYVIALIIPGHFYILFTYALFPLMLKHLDLLLVSEQINYASLLVLFFLFPLCSPGFANIGVIYVLLIACFVYSASVFFANGLSPKFLAARLAIFGGLVFLSNMWWLAPHLSNLRHVVAMSRESAVSITAGVRGAAAYATPLNIFTGRPQGMLYLKEILGNDFYVSGPVMAIFAAILGCFLVALFFRRKYIYVLLAAMLLSVFFVKGPQPPFSGIFMWAYAHVPGFQILRRPDSKFYGFFLCFYWAIATSGALFLYQRYFRDKLRASLFFVTGILASGYMVAIFAITGGLIPFNIPPMYEEANRYLQKDGVTRLLMLPSLYGLGPLYTTAVNSYDGYDFVNDVFAFPKIFPDSSHNSNNEAYKGPTNDLMQLIRDAAPICEASRRLGVSHIMVRQDMVPTQNMEDKPLDLISILNKHPDVRARVVFGGKAGFSFYKLKKECIDGLISAWVGEKKLKNFSFNVFNPGKIVLQFERLKGSARLDLLTNYNENWRIYPYPVGSDIVCGGTAFNAPAFFGAAGKACGSIQGFFTDAKYLILPSLPLRHSVAYGYANSWLLDQRLIVENSPPAYYTINPDGSINFRLVLYYQTQGYVFSGAVIALITLAVLLLLWLRQRLSRANI